MSKIEVAFRAENNSHIQYIEMKPQYLPQIGGKVIISIGFDETKFPVKDVIMDYTNIDVFSAIVILGDKIDG